MRSKKVKEGLVGMPKGSGAHNNQSCKKDKSLRLRRSFLTAEWEDNDNHGEEKGYYNPQTSISTSVDRREETEESTCTGNGESLETTELEQGRDDCFMEEEVYYDTQIEAQGAV